MSLHTVNMDMRSVLVGRYDEIVECSSEYCGLSFYRCVLTDLFPWTEAMASKSGSSGGLREPPSEQAVLNMYESMRSEISQIYSNITDLEMQVSEHSLVINAIQPLDQSRKCFRMIGGVLVERTIREVLPAVNRNKEGLEEVVRKLYETLEKKKRDLSEFEAKYKIRLRKQEDSKEEGNKKEGNAQGVLVGAASSSQ